MCYMRNISVFLIILIFGTVVGGVLGAEIAPIVFLGVWGWMMSAGLYSSIVVGGLSYLYIYKYDAFHENKNLIFGLAVSLGFIGPYIIDMIPVPSWLFESNEAAVPADKKKIVAPEDFGASLVNSKGTKMYGGYYIQPRCEGGQAVGMGVFKSEGRYRAEAYGFECDSEKPRKIIGVESPVDLYFYGDGFLIGKPNNNTKEYQVFSSNGDSINTKITAQNTESAKATLLDSSTSDDNKRMLRAALSDTGLLLLRKVGSEEPLYKMFLDSSTINSYLSKEDKLANGCDDCLLDKSYSGNRSENASKIAGEYYFSGGVLSDDFLRKIAIAEAMSDAGDTNAIAARISVINEVVNIAANDNQSDIASLLKMANIGADKSEINESAKKLLRNTKFEKNFGRWYRFKKQARAINESNISDSKLPIIERANRQQNALALDPLDREISGNLAYYCLLAGDLFCAQKYVAYTMALSRPDNKTIRSFDLQIFSAIASAEDAEIAARALVVAHSVSGNVPGFCNSVKQLNSDIGNRLASAIGIFSKKISDQDCF